MMNKVLFITRDLRIGGIEKALVQVLDLIDYNKNDVTLYLRSKDIDLISFINENVKIVVNETSEKKSLVILALTFLYKAFAFLKRDYIARKIKRVTEQKYKDLLERRQRVYFADTEYDVAIAYSHGYTARLLADIVKAKRKICIYHDSTDQYHAINQESFQHMNSIYAVNPNVIHILKEAYRDCRDKFEYLPNYIDYEGVINASKEEIIATRADIILCSAGRFSKEKGFDLAVKAAAVLKEKGVSFHWYFVGNGSERVKIERLINEYALNEYITLTGMKNNPYPYIRMCDVFVLPSYLDSMPVTISEALILQRPIVATKTQGGIAYSNEYGCIWLTDFSGENIAETIISKMNNAEEKDRVLSLEKAIDWSKKKKRLVEIWDDILQNR